MYTTTEYDALDRPIRVTFPDGSATVTDYGGDTTTVTDPAGKRRTLLADALGRTVKVTEDPGAGRSNWDTTYTYDAAGRLLQAVQGIQTRTFTYDTMGWLRTARSPEKTADDTYLYDDNGNLTKKTSGGFTIDFELIDGLNRVTRKRYSDQPSAPLTYTYDTCAGGKGRLCSTAYGDTAVSYTFDAAGRVTASTQTTASTPYAFQYTYDLADALESIEYPSGRKVHYGFDPAGRVTSVAAAAPGGPTYAGSIQYWPHGAARQVTLGNGLVETQSYNERLQMIGAGVGGKLELRLRYCANGALVCTTNNGNVLRQEIDREKSGGGLLTLRQEYGYDEVNRLTSASETVLAGGGTGGSWNLGFGYDRYGNQWVAAASIPVSFAAARNAAQYDAATNRLAKQYNDQALPAGAYASGGELQDHPWMGQMQYDAEGRVKQYTSGATTVTFAYDAEGRRVKKTSSAGTVVYVYDAGGALAAEYGGPVTAGTRYVTADHLGSTRAVTNAAGQVQEAVDYFPFGEQIPANATHGNRDLVGQVGGVGIPVRFTGKERDAETGFDYFGARYLSSAQGRWTSPDTPLVYSRPDNPQTWNLYSYVGNNPLRTVDLDGHCGLDWNCWGEFGSGVADTTYRPIVQAVTSPVQTVRSVASAVAHPVDTAVAVKDAVAETTSAALSGDPRAVGQVDGTVLSAVATAGATRAVTSVAKGSTTTNLYRAVDTAEATSIHSARAFTAAPNGTEFKGFFFAEADAQSFGSRMTQMTGETHSVVQGVAPTKLVKNSPSHTAATEGRGVLIRNEDLPKVRVRNQ